MHRENMIPCELPRTSHLTGKSKEPVWLQAPGVSGFMQANPLAGNAPSEKTECRFVYNDEYLYMGVKVFILSHPKLFLIQWNGILS